MADGCNKDSAKLGSTYFDKITSGDLGNYSGLLDLKLLLPLGTKKESNGRSYRAAIAIKNKNKNEKVMVKVTNLLFLLRTRMKR